MDLIGVVEMNKKIQDLQWKINEYRFVLNNPTMFAQSVDKQGIKYYYQNRIEQCESEIQKELERENKKNEQDGNSFRRNGNG